MNHSFDLADPALTLALALGVGMIAQVAARHLRIPGIVLLLAAGLLLGPDLLDWIRPQALGPALQALVGFAVAVILFEGGMNLDFRRLRREALSIRRLVTVGALVTAAGGALAARSLLQWDWTPSLLFGTLVIVTGPTVINPLLRRIRVQRGVATVLEAEGVLVDAIGAIIAVVALEVVLGPAGAGLAQGFWSLASRLGLGAAGGALGGLAMAALLRFEDAVPEGLENVFTLSLVLALFQVANSLLPESGIVAVTAAGLVVGNVRARALRDLKEFKEQLTVMLIGLLFVLLAADVRVAEMRDLGWRGIATVLVLMLVVRPLNVVVGTWGSELALRERAFIAWLAPRGIVAAAVSSLFAQELAAAGIPGGSELRALVFMVIAVTVLVQGLTGGLVARLLGVDRPSNSGYVILGASPLALALARILRECGDQEVLLLDSNPDAARAAEEEGFRVLFGSGLRESLMLRAGLDSRIGCIGTTSNDELNLMFAHRARDRHKVPQAWVAIRLGHRSVSAQMVAEEGAKVLFDRPRNLDLWSVRMERDLATVESWTLADPSAWESAAAAGDLPESLLPMAWRRGDTAQPYDPGVAFKPGDVWCLAIFVDQRAEAEDWLRGAGWERLPEPPG